MTSTEIVIAGFGGQGVLLAGKVLAQAGLGFGLHVTWLPSYGPEMRGGTANVIVCLSSEPIASPLVTTPQTLLALNRPSLDRFAPDVKPGGMIIINSSLVKMDPDRDDCSVVMLGAREIAREAGNDQASNLAMLGALVGTTGVVPEENVIRAIEKEFAGRKERFVPSNIAAFLAGAARGRSSELATSTEEISATRGGEG